MWLLQTGPNVTDGTGTGAWLLDVRNLGALLTQTAYLEWESTCAALFLTAEPQQRLDPRAATARPPIEVHPSVLQSIVCTTRQAPRRFRPLAFKMFGGQRPPKPAVGFALASAIRGPVVRQLNALSKGIKVLGITKMRYFVKALGSRIIEGIAWHWSLADL